MSRHELSQPRQFMEHPAARLTNTQFSYLSKTTATEPGGLSCALKQKTAIYQPLVREASDGVALVGVMI